MVSTVSGAVGDALHGRKAEYWVQQARQRVQSAGAIEVAMSDLGCNVLVEIGPHPQLCSHFGNRRVCRRRRSSDSDNAQRSRRLPKPVRSRCGSSRERRLRCFGSICNGRSTGALPATAPPGSSTGSSRRNRKISLCITIGMRTSCSGHESRCPCQ